MRLIGTLSSEFLARRFSIYLQTKGVHHSCDGAFDAATGYISYQIWVYDEDQIGRALRWFSQFQNDSCHVDFQVDPPTSPQSPPPTKSRSALQKLFMFPVTYGVIFLCSILFGAIAFESRSESTSQTPPIASLFLFDAPVSDQLPWMGFSPIIQEKLGKPIHLPPQGKPFEQIREGQIWRLVSPVFLHDGMIHILFNMLWVWALGRPIEQRIGSLRTILLILIVAIISNTLQYLAIGPFFVGYSGVVMGYAGFIWSRMKVAPWEGYPIPRSTLFFLFLFVIGMWAFQMLSSVAQFVFSVPLSLHIANTAHIIGGLVGVALGRLPFFGWKPR